jgi:hypothetical protein
MTLQRKRVYVVKTFSDRIRIIVLGQNGLSLNQFSDKFGIYLSTRERVTNNISLSTWRG